VKRLIGAVTALAMALAAAPVRAGVVEVTQFPLIVDYDLDSATYQYPVTQGIPDASIAATSKAEGVLSTIKGNARITTSGASTTVTAFVASSEPFAAVQAGDYIRATTLGAARPDVVDVVAGGQTPWLKVVTRTDANNITVNQSVNFEGGVSFEWRRASVSSEAGRGWVPVSSFDRAKFTFAINQANTTTGIDARVECRDNLPGIETDSIVVVYPYDNATCSFGTLSTDTCTFTATSGTNGKLSVDVDTKSWYECRVGMKLTSTDDGNDLGANLEKIRVDVILVKEGR
jgi:hypothetical protein